MSEGASQRAVRRATNDFYAWLLVTVPVLNIIANLLLELTIGWPYLLPAWIVSLIVYAVTVDGESQGEKAIWMILDTMFGQGAIPGEVVHIRRELHPNPSRKAMPAAG